MELRYIILNGKTPIESLSDGGHPIEEVEQYEHLGLLIPKPYVVLDIDSREEADLLLDIVRSEHVKCGVMQTPHGAHFWFKSDTEMKNSVKTRLAIGLTGDFRSWGTKQGRAKLSYTRVKRDGKWCEWLIEPNDIGEFPHWLRPVHKGADFAHMEAGDGRNQELFNYILALTQRGFTQEQTKETLRIINDYVFLEPLEESELATITRDESFPDPETLVPEFFDEKGNFQHDVFAIHLISDMRIVTVDGVTYVYRDGYYQPAEREIERRMIDLFPSIRISQRRETLDYIQIITAVSPDSLPTNEYYLNCENTRLDVRTLEELPFSPESMDFVRIPVVYDPTAKSDLLVATLRKVFCYDDEVMLLFEEMVGYMLMKNARFRKGFLLHGSGSNGKSTVLNVLKAFLGHRNVSTVELKDLGSDRFLPAELYHKLANIGDDIEATEIKDTAKIKKLFTGESQPVQRKFGQPFDLYNHAKLVFSCNELPRITDRSDGMYSRLVFIPFNAKFSPNDPDFDPFIEEKLTAPVALSALLNLGLRGLSRLLSRGRFTEPQSVLESSEAYRIENSTTLSWVNDESLTIDQLTNVPTEHLYGEMCDWCQRRRVKYPPGFRTFHRDLENEFKLTRKRARNADTGGKYKWVFVAVTDE